MSLLHTLPGMKMSLVMVCVCVCVYFFFRLDKADKVLASYSHAVNKNSTVVSSFSYGLSKDAAGVQDMAVGGVHQVCPESKVTTMYKTDGTLSTVYETNVRPNVVLSLGSVLNINDMSGHQLGFKLSLGE